MDDPRILQHHRSYLTRDFIATPRFAGSDEVLAVGPRKDIGHLRAMHWADEHLDAGLRVQFVRDSLPGCLVVADETEARALLSELQLEYDHHMTEALINAN